MMSLSRQVLSPIWQLTHFDVGVFARDWMTSVVEHVVAAGGVAVGVESDCVVV